MEVRWRRYDCRDAGVRATPGAVAENRVGNSGRGAVAERSLSPIHGLRDTCTSVCNGIRTPGRLPVNGFQVRILSFPRIPPCTPLYRKVLKFVPILDTIILAHTLYTASYTAQLVGNSLLPRSAKSTVTVRTAYRRLHSLSVPSGPSSTRLNRSQRTALKLTGAATVQLFNLPSGYCTSM